MAVLTKLNNNTRPQFLQANNGFVVHFDRGDVAWLRAYCHLLSAMIDDYRSVDMPRGFGRRVAEVFPRVEFDDGEATAAFCLGLRISDPIRLRSCREHLVQVTVLNRETWHHIRLETDDSSEWLPHPGQTDQLDMPLRDAQIDTWLGMMQQLDDLLSGRSLVPSPLLQFITQKNPSGMGLNLARLLNDPPEHLFDFQRIRNEGIDQRYLEPERGRQLMDFDLIFRVGAVFSGPFGPLQAVQLN